MASNQANSSSTASSSSQSTSMLSTASQSDFGTVFNAFSYIPLKLDSKNYIFWKAQVMATIRAFDLVSFLTKSSSSSKYVAHSNGDEMTINPEYIAWLRSNQLLLDWLFSMIIEEVLAHVIQCELSTEVCLYL